MAQLMKAVKFNDEFCIVYNHQIDDSKLIPTDQSICISGIKYPLYEPIPNTDLKPIRKIARYKIADYLVSF